MNPHVHFVLPKITCPFFPGLLLSDIESLPTLPSLAVVEMITESAKKNKFWWKLQPGGACVV